MSRLAFDERTGRQLEALYEIADAVRRREYVRAALRARRGERILDVGCGPGFVCAELLDEVGDDGSVVGIDSSPQMLALAERRCGGQDNFECHEADAVSLPVEEASFDGVLCVQVLEYLPEPSRALAEMLRVLGPEGRAVVWDTDWSTVSWHSADPRRMCRVLEAWDEHLAHPSLPRTLAPALRKAGFEGVEIEAHTFATAALGPDTFGASLIALIEGFVDGHKGVSRDEASAWAAEQHDLRAKGESFFAYTQFCFTARRP